MFKSKVYCLILIISTLVFYTAWLFYTPTSKNYRDYQNLMAYSGIYAKGDESQTLARQERDQVSKQLIFKQGDKRLQWRMKSLRSDFYLQQTGSSIQLIESLENMFCLMEEKEFFRSLEALHANYQYKDRLLMAENVLLNRYKIEEDPWLKPLSIYQPFMQGNARKVELNFSQNPSFKAFGFQAIFQEWN